MTRPLLLVLVAAVAAPAVGQTATGRVTDAETGRPVVGATVRVEGAARGAAADADGRFSLALGAAGPFRLVVSAIGYATAERAATADDGAAVRVDVALAPAALEAGAVVVTATRIAKALEDVAVPTTVIDAEAIRRQGAVRLGDVLEDVPGLFVFDDHGGGVQVQGLSSDYTLVLINGEPVVGRTAGTLDVDRLTVAGVERVEVVEGPSSSLYGSEALAGVVNLVTALPTAGETGSLRLRAGSYGGSDATAEAAVGRDRWAARAFVNRYGSAGYDLTPDAFGPTVPEFTDWTADGRARIDLGPARLTVGARAAVQEQAGAFALREGGAEVPYDDAGRRADWSVHPEITVPLSGRVRVVGTLYGARYTTETRHRRRPDGALVYSDDFDQRYAKAEVQLDATWNVRHLSVVGGGAVGERLAGDRYAPAAGGATPRASQAFAFAQHEWAPSRRLALTASARFDAHSDYAARLTPKVAALVRPAPGVTVSAGGFWNDVSDLIETQPVAQKTNGQSVFGYFNLAEVYTRGLDAQVAVRPARGLDLVASYQLLQARDRAVVDALGAGTVFGRDPDGREVRLGLGDYGGLFGRSPHAATARATYAVGNGSAQVRARWRSAYGYRDLDGNGLANRDDEFVAGYAVVDLTLTHDWALGGAGRLTAQAGVDNLTDVTRAALVPSMPGRTVFASLGLSF